MKTIRYEVVDGIATITLNRPEKMNALTYDMGVELLEAFDLSDADDSVRAVIVTGSGNRAFCAGADISGENIFDYAKREDQPGKPCVNGIYPDTGGRVALRMFDSLKPVIGAVNGVAAGFGATILLPMDVRIAADNARFGFVFARRGIVPETASSWFLPRIVGISTALDWCYSGRVFDATEALDKGLVSEVHSHDHLLEAARKLATSYIETSAPVSIALTRQMMWKMLGADHPIEAHKVDSRGVMDRGKSSDAVEGVASFREKRSPRFEDKVSRDLPAFFPWWKARVFE